jgi:hypothetical protein
MSLDIHNERQLRVREEKVGGGGGYRDWTAAVLQLLPHDSEIY